MFSLVSPVFLFLFFPPVCILRQEGGKRGISNRSSLCKLYRSQIYLCMTHKKWGFSSKEKAFWTHYSSCCGCALIWNKAAKVGGWGRRRVLYSSIANMAFMPDDSRWKQDFHLWEFSGSCVWAVQENQTSADVIKPFVAHFCAIIAPSLKKKSCL